MVSSVVRVLAVTASVGVLGMIVACAPESDTDINNLNGGLEAQGCTPDILKKYGGFCPKEFQGDGKEEQPKCSEEVLKKYGYCPGTEQCSEEILKKYGYCPGGGDGRGGGGGIDTTGFERDKSNCVGVTINQLFNAGGLTVAQLKNIRIAPILRSRETNREEVDCVWTHDDQYPAGKCEFNTDTTNLMWALGTFNGIQSRYAIAGQFLWKTEAEGSKQPAQAHSNWVIGTVTQAVTLQDGSQATAVKCVGGTGADVSGTGTSDELASACTPEAFNVPGNAAGGQMDNYATLAVCSSAPAPSDVGEMSVATTATGTPPPAGSKCVIGEGAALNSANGTERNKEGAYLSGSHRCHVATSSGVEVYAAKRPATRPYPAAVDMLTPTWWRPTSPLRIGN